MPTTYGFTRDVTGSSPGPPKQEPLQTNRSLKTKSGPGSISVRSRPGSTSYEVWNAAPGAQRPGLRRASQQRAATLEELVLGRTGVARIDFGMVLIQRLFKDPFGRIHSEPVQELLREAYGGLMLPSPTKTMFF